MIRLDIASLEIFVAAVDLKSLSKAAEHESVVTSAASKRVAELERQLGNPRLLHRHGRGVEATPAGVALYQRAKAILRSIKLAEDEVASFAPHGAPKVRLAASRSTVVHYLPNSLRDFMRKHTDTHIDLIERMSPDIPRVVVEGVADIGITTRTAAAPGVLSWPSHEDRVELIVPRGASVGRKGGPIFLEQAVDYEFIGYFPRHSYEAFLDLASVACRARCRSSSTCPTSSALPHGARGAGHCDVARQGRPDIDQGAGTGAGAVERRLGRAAVLCLRARRSASAPAARSLLQHFMQAGGLDGLTDVPWERPWPRSAMAWSQNCHESIAGKPAPTRSMTKRHCSQQVKISSPSDNRLIGSDENLRRRRIPAAFD